MYSYFLYMHFPYLNFPVLVFSAPPAVSVLAFVASSGNQAYYVGKDVGMTGLVMIFGRAPSCRASKALTSAGQLTHRLQTRPKNSSLQSVLLHCKQANLSRAR